MHASVFLFSAWSKYVPKAGKWDTGLRISLQGYPSLLNVKKRKS
jgi:hypothetical protein